MRDNIVEIATTAEIADGLRDHQNGPCLERRRSAPAPYLDLLTYRLGFMPWEGWAGWRIVPEGLWTPEGTFFTP